MDYPEANYATSQPQAQLWLLTYACAFSLSPSLPLSVLDRQRENVPGLQAGQLLDDETVANTDEPPATDSQGQNEIVAHLRGHHHRVPHLLDTLLCDDDNLLVLESR